MSAAEDEDQNAARELAEELSIIDVEPEFVFKFKQESEYTRCWCYVYFTMHAGSVKPQESEIDALFFWDEDKIVQMIN